MRAALGTIDVEDDVRKAIRQQLGGKGHATRGEVKDYYLGLIERHNKLLVAGEVGNEGEQPAAAAAPEDRPSTEWTGGESQLPEPTSAGDSTPSTASTTATAGTAEGVPPTTGA